LKGKTLSMSGEASIGLKRKSAFLLGRKKRVKLILSIPLLIAGLVLLSGFIVFSVERAFLAETQLTKANVERVIWYTKLVILSSVAMALICGTVLAYAITWPIKQVSTGMQSVASGDITPSVKLHSSVELETLGESFNQMVSVLNRYMLESIAGGMIVINTNGIVTAINPVAELILGYDSEEVVGHSFAKIFSRSQTESQLGKIIVDALEYNQPHSFAETTIVTKDQKQLPVGVISSFLKDENGIMLGVLLTFKQLTEIKLLQEQMHRTDRLAALGTLAAGVAHEVRNPLGSIRGLAELLAENIASEDPKRQYTSAIVKEADRLNNVVDGLLNFARPTQEPKLQRKDVNAILMRALALVRHNDLWKDAQVVEDYETALPKLVVEEEKMTQAFLNIILNALQALPQEDGVLKLRTTSEQRTKTEEFARIRIEITDNGCGIPSEHLDKVFDPFFTTKENGTGLGLAVAHQIITAHSGSIDVKSKSGDGTTFIIKLPVAPRSDYLLAMTMRES
jgi:PAS domain S-box-containing protein